MSAEETFQGVLTYIRQYRSLSPDPAKPVFWLGAGCSV